jgi:hypothetical protein
LPFFCFGIVAALASTNCNEHVDEENITDLPTFSVL